MKKLVAALLCASFVLACACTDKEETTKKKKKKKTSTTEETEDTTEPGESSSDEPTEPTDSSSETEDTSESSDTSSQPVAPVFTDTLVYDQSLDFLDFENDPYDLIYGVENPNSSSDYNSIVSVHVNYDEYWLWDAPNDDLEDIIDDLYWDIEDKYDTLYAERLQELLDGIANNQYPEYGTNIFCSTDVTRADSLFLSFYIMEPGDDDKAIVTSYNYITPTAETIRFEDVVIDKEALCDYVSANSLFNNTDEILAKIRDGSVPFCLTYDGIVLISPISSNYAQSAKISAISNSNQGIFNMGYFGATPSSYMLEAGPDDKIYWDVTGDGITDEITITYPSDTFYRFEELTFDISGVSTTIKEADSDDLDGEYYNAYLICSDGNFFICVETTIEDDYSIQLIFRINSDLSVSFQGRTDGYFDTEPYNPNYIEISDISQFIGTGVQTNQYYFDLATGNFERFSSMSYRNYKVLVTKTDIAAKNYLDDSDMTIPAGTSVTLVSFDKEAQIAYFSTLYEDDFDNKIFYLTFTIEDYAFRLDAGNEQDLFTGLFYAG